MYLEMMLNDLPDMSWLRSHSLTHVGPVSDSVSPTCLNTYYISVLKTMTTLPLVE